MRARPRMKRIEDSAGAGGMDLAALEEFCASARANGADGAVAVGAWITLRGAIRKVWVDIPVERPGGLLRDPGSRVFPPVR